VLKARVIPVLLISGAGLVKGQDFDASRRVGPALPAVRVHERRQVDELIFLDVLATPERRGPDFLLIAQVADECFMPLTVGGGIKTVEDIRTVLAVGADKVALNTQAMNEPELIDRAARKFGSQAIVVSIDARLEDGLYEAWTHCGKVPAEVSPVDWAREVEARGAGEILLQSIDHDGQMAGYDLDLIAMVSSAVRAPVIALGGCGAPEHCAQALAAGASAVAVASLFQFTSCTPREVKRHLASRGIPVRL
jgi:cyclase